MALHSDLNRTRLEELPVLILFQVFEYVDYGSLGVVSGPAALLKPPFHNG